MITPTRASKLAAALLASLRERGVPHATAALLAQVLMDIRRGVNIETATVVRLAEIPNVVTGTTVAATKASVNRSAGPGWDRAARKRYPHTHTPNSSRT